MKDMELRNIHIEKEYLLAVSGGIDSMVMADLFVKNSINFQLVHCNFSLRAEESDLDEQLVIDWCASNNVTCHSKRFDTLGYAEEQSLSIQESARSLRYAYFSELLALHHLDYVATAHHQDDTIETVFFHFLRGTGIRGLTGIPATNQQIVRPMLHITRKDIEAYAAANGILYRNDSSNLKETYTRNRIRNTILPLIEETFPQLKPTMAKNIARFQEVHEIYQRSVETLRKKLIEQRGKDFYIPIRKLKHVSPIQTITYELIRPFHFSYDQALELVRMTDSPTGALLQSHTHRIIRNRDMFIITETATLHSDIILIDEFVEKVSCAHFDLLFKSVSEVTDKALKSADMAYIDADALKYPLLLRKWRQGDYLYPLGMTKKKKVARVLIDAKLSLPEKEKVWVLESDKKIVWILGMKLDNRFRLGEHTKRILQMIATKK